MVQWAGALVMASGMASATANTSSTKARRGSRWRGASRIGGSLGGAGRPYPSPQRLEVVSVLKEIAERGLTIREVWQAYQDGRSLATTAKITVGAAIADLVATKIAI